MPENAIVHKNVRAQLLFDLKEGLYAKCDRLPPESVLSEQMGISRTQLRDVLAALEREGFITRRHGVGTLINRHVLAVPTRTDIELEFRDMIRLSGGTPNAVCVQVSECPTDPMTAERLHLAPGTPVIRVANLCTSNGKPVIYWEDVFPKHLIKKDYTTEDCKQLIFTFMEEFCSVSAYLDLTDLHPALADATLAQYLQVPVGTPLLNFREVDFDIDGNPIFCSYQYFVDGAVQHTLLRKKL